MNLLHSQQAIAYALAPSINQHHFDHAVELLQNQHGVDNRERLLVYRHCVTAAQQRVLQMIYPVCEKILGEQCFASLARDYAWHSRSNCADLNGYGKFFHVTLYESITHHSELEAYGYLPDLARLEWVIHQLRYTSEVPSISRSNIAALTKTYAAELKLVTVPTIFLLNSPWPVYDIWQAHNLNRLTAEFTMPEATQYLLVTDQHITEVSLPIYLFLRLASEARTISDIAQQLGKLAEPAFAELTTMIDKGWLTSPQL